MHYFQCSNNDTKRRNVSLKMKMHHKINTFLLMMSEWLCTASGWGAVGITSPTTQDFPQTGVMHPSAFEEHIFPVLRKFLAPRGMYFPKHPSSRKCTEFDTIPYVSSHSNGEQLNTLHCDAARSCVTLSWRTFSGWLGA